MHLSARATYLHPYGEVLLYLEQSLTMFDVVTFDFSLQVYPNVSDNRQAALPPGSFLTCSADDTVRVWNIEEGENRCSTG